MGLECIFESGFGDGGGGDGFSTDGGTTVVGVTADYIGEMLFDGVTVKLGFL